MKLDKELKDRIDRYFENISANELYSILTEKYDFPVKDNNDVIVLDDQYLCKEDIVSEIINSDMTYAAFDVKQEVEVVKMKFLENQSDSQNEESVYNQTKSIPFAA